MFASWCQLFGALARKSLLPGLAAKVGDHRRPCLAVLWDAVHQVGDHFLQTYFPFVLRVDHDFVRNSTLSSSHIQLLAVVATKRDRSWHWERDSDAATQRSICFRAMLLRLLCQDFRPTQGYVCTHGCLASLAQRVSVAVAYRDEQCSTGPVYTVY